MAALTDSANPRDYWFKMKIRVKSDDGLALSTICRRRMESSAKRIAPTRKASSASSSRFRRPRPSLSNAYLAKVGYERAQEIEDPELATKRTKAIYRAKGYSDDWIEKRMRGIAIRAELTDEWKKRKVGRRGSTLF